MRTYYLRSAELISSAARVLSAVRILPVALILSAALISLSGCSSPHQLARLGKPASIDLDSVIAAIQVQIGNAESRLKQGNISLKIREAVVSLQITKTNIEGGDFQVLIFKPSGKRIAQKVTTISFDLKALKNDRITPKESGRKIDYSLADLIVASARKYDSLKADAINGLAKDNFVVDVLFSVEYDANMGLSFTLWGISADAGYELDNKVQHELVLTFD
jgi:hypothetical protein